ncbi:MAG: Iron dicitrate transport regulator FecR [Nitrospira sp.]|nr:FecR family protein [Nitrospira sp.]ULA62100.1 MAG: Iron dicitrate transport regulator FecR [Nitrospira sp.]
MMVTGVADQERDLLREAAEWFARADAEDFTEAERRRLETWRRRSPAHDEAFERVCRTWGATDLAVALESVPPADMPTRQRLHRRRRIRWAAAATLLVIAGWWALGSNFLITLRSDYATATGEQRTIHLPDQSSVVLNTNTALVSHVEGTSRLIHLLQGEALFQVRADATRPFIVEHAGHRVQVLGTEFIVRERQDITTITVVHGVVQVTSTNPASSSIQLTAGQRVSIGPNGAGPVSQVAAADATAWTRRRLVISDQPLSEVIDEIQRYHSGSIVIWNPSAREIRVTGIYDLTNMAETLTVLAKTLPIHMDRLTDRLIILR